MKTLQSNFTNPEQSKRLLELGVPVDSADCYLVRFGIDECWEVKVLLNNVRYSEIAISNQEYCLPCWSVGRLIEIFDLVGENASKCISTNKTESRINNLVRLYEENITLLDFSKLED